MVNVFRQISVDIFQSYHILHTDKSGPFVCILSMKALWIQNAFWYPILCWYTNIGIHYV